MKLRTPALAVLSIAVLFAVIGMSMLLGYWRTESSKISTTPSMSRPRRSVEPSVWQIRRRPPH